MPWNGNGEGVRKMIEVFVTFMIIYGFVCTVLVAWLLIDELKETKL